MAGLSIVIEGAPEKQVAEISSALIKKLEAKGKKCLNDTAFINHDENILAANQRLLDISNAQLAPNTLSLMVVIKLQQRLKKIQAAKSQENYCISNVSWLSDAAYYESRGNTALSEQLIIDCGLIRPDVWVIIDEPGGMYAKLAKRAGVRVYSPKLPRTQLINTILEHIALAEKKQSSTKKPPATKEPTSEKTEEKSKQQKVITVSRLALPVVLETISGQKTTKPYIFEKKGKDGTYPYYRPTHIGPKVLKAYTTIMDKIFDNYTRVVPGVAAHLQSLGTPKDATIQAARSVSAGMVPLAALMSVTSEQSISYNNSDMYEVEQLLPGKTPQKKGKNLSELDVLAAELLPQNFDGDTTPGPALVSFSPRNEMEILAPILFESAEASMPSLREAAMNLPGEKKQLVFETYLRSGHDRKALKDAMYVWDVLSEYEVFENASLVLPEHSIQKQSLTPRYGYDIPAVIEESGITDLYQQAFDLSLELYNLLQAAGYGKEAQYAVLAGHRLHWKISIDAEDLRKFMKNGALSSLTSLKDQMKLHVAEVHPLIAQFL